MPAGPALSALADPTRRAVLERLAAGPRSVTDIAHALPVSRPAVSQHLKVLHDAGLVSVRQEGRTRLYAVRRDGLAELRAWLEQFWDTALQSYARVVEEVVATEDLATDDVATDDVAGGGAAEERSAR